MVAGMLDTHPIDAAVKEIETALNEYRLNIGEDDETETDAQHNQPPKNRMVISAVINKTALNSPIINKR